MALPKLMLDVTDAYSPSLGNEIASVEVEAGPAWRRRDFYGAVHMVQVQWVLEAPAYNYLMAFYRAVIDMGALPFLCDLMIDHADMEEYQVALRPGTLQPSGRKGDAYTVSATLEVKPNMSDLDYDASYAAMYQIYGNGIGDMAAAVAKFANVQYPALFPAA